MNICLLTQEWPPFGCGIGSYMYNLARGFSIFGHHVTVITHDQNPAQLEGVTVVSVGVSTIPLSLMAKIQRKTNKILRGIVHPWSWWAYEEFKKCNEIQRFDIIETADFGAWGWHFVNNGNVPVTVRCHNPAHVVWSINQFNWFNGWPFCKEVQKQDYLERMQTAKADGIVAPSEALACHLGLSWVIPLSRISVIPNPIDSDLFVPPHDESVKNEILYVGRLEFSKGVYDLAQSIIPVLDNYPNVIIRFVGMDRPVIEPYQVFGQTASEAILGLIPCHLHHRVIFTSHVPVAEIVRFQQSALCSVMPTRGFENFPYTVLEPMACGTPVIATRCGGPSEIITHGVDGLLIPPGRPKSLSEAIEYLIKSPELCSKISDAARKTIEEKYSNSAVIPKIIGWYEEVINEFKSH